LHIYCTLTHSSVYDKICDIIYRNKHRNPDRVQCLSLFFYGKI